MMASNELILGTGENHLDHEMDIKLREEHMHVIGAPGSGKSRFLLSLIMQDIQHGRGVCVIDPHGELVDHIKDWLAKNERVTERRSVQVLDFNDLEYSFGYNPLAVTDERQISAVVQRAVVAIATANGGGDINQMPLLANSLTHVCTALAYANLNLTEAKYLLDPYSPHERFAITDKIRNPESIHAWRVLNEIAHKQPRMYLERFEAAGRRISAMTSDPFTRAIIGQREKRIDLNKSMDAGDIILVNLSQEGGFVPEQSANMLGRLMVNSFLGAALQRAPRTSRPFGLYIDEVHNFLSGDIPKMLEECRKFGLHLTLSHQHLGQLKGEDEKVYDGVMAAARNKVCFALDNPEDADVMQRRIFAGHYNFERPKRSMDKPVVVGHEIIELHSSSASQSEATTEGTASAEAISYMEAQGITESSATSLSETESSSLAHSRSKSSGTSDTQSSGQNNMSSFGQGASTGGGVTDSASAGSGAGAGSSVSFGGGATIDQDGNPVSTTDNMGGGESLSMMNTAGSGVAHSASHGMSHTASHGSGSSTGVARGTSQSITDAITSSQATSSGKTDTHGTAESFSTANGNTQSQGRSLGKMKGSTVSQGVSQTLRPILEERHTVLYSLEELKHLFTDSILTLPKRTAFAIIAGQGMAKIETLDVPDLIVSPKRKARVIGAIKHNSPVHKLMVNAQREIEMRVQYFMEDAYPLVLDDPMNPPAQLDSEHQPPLDDPMNPDG